MRKIIITGVIFTSFLLLFTPSITAIEYKEIKDTYRENIEKEITSSSNILKIVKTKINLDSLKKLVITLYVIVYFLVFRHFLWFNYHLLDEPDELFLFLISHALWTIWASFIILFVMPIYFIYLVIYAWIHGVPFKSTLKSPLGSLL